MTESSHWNEIHSSVMTEVAPHLHQYIFNWDQQSGPKHWMMTDAGSPSCFINFWIMLHKGRHHNAITNSPSNDWSLWGFNRKWNLSGILCLVWGWEQCCCSIPKVVWIAEFAPILPWSGPDLALMPARSMSPGCCYCWGLYSQWWLSTEPHSSVLRLSATWPDSPRLRKHTAREHSTGAKPATRATPSVHADPHTHPTHHTLTQPHTDPPTHTHTPYTHSLRISDLPLRLEQTSQHSLQLGLNNRASWIC